MQDARPGRLAGTALLAAVLTGTLLAGTVLAGCGARPATPAATGHARPAVVPAAPGPAGDWPTYHRNPARTGVGVDVPAAGRLSEAWRARLDGTVYGQPLVIGNTVVAATENDSVYGLDRSTGRVRWRAHAGTPVPLARQPCGDIDPLGITGTPVYDPATGLVYAVAQTTGSRHFLLGVSLATGRVRLRRAIPAPDGHPAYDQQRGALALAAGRVYVTFGGHFGDCGPYVGSVVGVPASGDGPLVTYRVPTARAGGVWAPGGVVTGADGTLYVSVGNGAATRPPFDDSDSVTALTPGLRRIALFAPATWAADNAGDLDLGSMSPALLPGGRILAVGKRGTGYLLRAARLGGVGGQVAQRGICPAFGAAAVTGVTAYIPCQNGGLAAVSAAGDTLRVRWRGPGGATGSPVVGGGAVWVADPAAGVLYQLSPATGRVRQQVSVGSVLPHFASPSLSGGLVLLGTAIGVVAVAGA